MVLICQIAARHATMTLCIVLTGLLCVSGCRPTDDTHDYKYLYQIGQIESDVADELYAAFTVIPHDGGASAPFMIDGETVLGLTDDEIAAVQLAFTRGFPLIVINATADQLTGLYQLLGYEEYTFGSDNDTERIELFAIDLEDDGTIHEWIQYPPVDTAAVAFDFDDDGVADDTDNETIIDTDTAQNARVDAFSDWMAADDARANPCATLVRQARASGYRGADAQDLASIAAGFRKTIAFQYEQSLYTLNYFILSFHEVETHADWFLIMLEGLFDGKSAYRGERNQPVDPDSWGYGYADYLRCVEVTNSVGEFRNDLDNLIMTHPSPDTVNKIESVSTTTGFTLGGTIKAGKGSDGFEAGGEVSGEFSWSESHSFEVQDVEVLNECSGNVARWRFEFRQPVKDSYHWGTARMKEPTRLSRSTFHPWMTWVYRASPTVRNRRPVLLPEPVVVLESSQALFYSDTPLRKTKTIRYSEQDSRPVALPWPVR